MLRQKPGHSRLQDLRKPLVKQRDGRERLSSRAQNELRGPSGDRQRLQIRESISFGHRIGNVADRLRRLADRYISYYLVRRSIDDGESVIILEPDKDVVAVTRRPNAVRKAADRYGGDTLEIIGAEYLHLVESADADIGKLALRRVDEIDMVGEGPGIHDLELREGWMSVDHHSGTDILQRVPDLPAIGRCGNVRTEGAGLR